MFISVSAASDTEAQPGHRSVMHLDYALQTLAPWEGLSPDIYHTRKQEVGERLMAARQASLSRPGSRSDSLRDRDPEDL